MALTILRALGLLWLLSFQGALSLSFRLQHRYSEQASNKRGGMSSQLFQRLQHHDTKRHARNLLGAAVFPVGGSADPEVAGLYFTELNIGTPPSPYYVQVDTGSDLLWLSCGFCMTCQTSTNLGVPLTYYDPYSSPTSQQVVCNEQYCALTPTDCISGGSCTFQLAYGDGTTVTCFLVQDVLELPIVANHSVQTDHATAAFGCATYVSGGQQNAPILDGILGLGQSNMSIIEQLAFQGKTPRIFAHCLEGDKRGGGILVIGDVMEPGLVYTPLMNDRLHYKVNLKSIEVNGQILNVDSSIGATGENQGTIIDSGTTLAYIPDPAYTLLLQKILNSGPSNLETKTRKGLTCFLHEGSLDDAFPTVTFTFENGAAMLVRPHDYILQLQISTDSNFCIGFQRSMHSIADQAILGDLVLKNKLVVYDLEKQQIGWVDYNCSSNVTVLSSTHQPIQVLGSTIGNPSPIGAADSLRAGMGFAFLFPLYIVARVCLYSEFS